MKRRSFFLFCSLVGGALSAFAADVPRKAPDYAIQTGPEKYIWLSEYSGKTVVLAFILTTCPHCQFTTGVLNNLEKEYAPKGVVFLESAIEPMSSLHIADFKKALNVDFPVGYNEQSYAATFLGAGPNDPMLMPQMVVIDAKGMISTQFAGDEPGFARPQQEATIRAAIDKALGATSKPTAKPAAPKPVITKK